MPKPSFLSTINVSSANQLLGLRFGNKIDNILDNGLTTRTLTYVYGKNANPLLNSLCGNVLKTYKGHAIFFDAGLSFDPYFIVRDIENSDRAEALLKSVIFSRAFTCHQLTEMVTAKLPKLISSDHEINAVIISGIDSVFNEEDSPKDEIESLQFLIAASLNEAAREKGIIYTIASSEQYCKHLLNFSDTAIKLYQRDKKEFAYLAKHYSKAHTSIEL